MRRKQGRTVEASETTASHLVDIAKDQRWLNKKTGRPIDPSMTLNAYWQSRVKKAGVKLSFDMQLKLAKGELTIADFPPEARDELGRWVAHTSRFQKHHYERLKDLIKILQELQQTLNTDNYEWTNRDFVTSSGILNLAQVYVEDVRDLLQSGSKS